MIFYKISIVMVICIALSGCGAHATRINYGGEHPAFMIKVGGYQNDPALIIEKANQLCDDQGYEIFGTSSTGDQYVYTMYGPVPTGQTIMTIRCNGYERKQ